jgi:hypothetical protein
MMTSLTTTYEGEKVLFKVIPKEVVSWDAETEYPVPSIVMPKEKKITGSSVIFRILMADDQPDLYLWIDYSRDSAKFPYTMYKNFHIHAKNDKTWKYNKASHTYGAWISLPDVGDYRVRVQALYSKSSSVGTDIWSEWRYFHVGTHRKLQIIWPEKKKTYTGTIPLKIILPETATSDLKMTLTWTWTEAPSNGVHHFTQPVLTRTVKLPSHPVFYKGSVPAPELIAAKKKAVKDGGINGSFRLEAKITTAGGVETASADFYIAQLAPPVSDDQGKKKNLSYPTTFPGPTVLPLKLRYRPLEEIGIRMKNTGSTPPAFQVRYRPAAGRAYIPLRRVPHRFAPLGNITTLRLKFKKPGQYQVRFRAGEHEPWGDWHGFEVVGTGLAGVKKEKMLKPGHPKIRLAPPAIETPVERQTFMMTGNETRIHAKIRHAAGYKVVMEVQYGKHGKFTAIRPKVSRRNGKTESRLEIRLTKAGQYRIRAKLAASANAAWSDWREFKVDQANLKLIHKIKPQSHIKKQTAPVKRIHLNPAGIKIK